MMKYHLQSRQKAVPNHNRQPVSSKDQSETGVPESETVEERYLALFRMILSSLRPGGHLLIGDHVGALGLAAHLKQLVGDSIDFCT